MKTNIFDFKRVGLLFQRYFAERSHTELIYWSIMAIVFMFFRSNPMANLFMIVIAGMIYAARFFKEIHSRSNGVAYFMIPATQLEKLFVGIVMTTVYYFGMMMIAYVTGNLLGTFINNMLANVNLLGLNIFQYSPLQWKLFMSFSFNYVNGELIQTYDLGNSYIIALIKSFLFNQSIFLLGSIYFKNNHVGKTMGAVFIIQVLLLILLTIEVRLITGGYSINMTSMQYAQDFGMKVKNILLPVLYLTPPFLWVVSYFRLTEKQV